MRRLDVIAATAGTAIGIAYLVGGLGYERGSAAEPGPGFYPLYIGIFILLASLVFGLQSWFKKGSRNQDQAVDWPQGATWYRVAAIVGACVLYLILLGYAGQIIAATLASLIALQAMGSLRWYTKLGTAAAIGLGSYLLFSVILKVPLPTGIWFT